MRFIILCIAIQVICSGCSTMVNCQGKTLKTFLGMPWHDPCGHGGRSNAVSFPKSTDCESGHWISSISQDGKLIVLENGTYYIVSPVDQYVTSLWLQMSDVIICGSKIINLDEKESAEITQVQ